MLGAKIKHRTKRGGRGIQLSRSGQGIPQRGRAASLKGRREMSSVLGSHARATRRPPQPHRDPREKTGGGQIR